VSANQHAASGKKITFTEHAREAMVKRELDEESVIEAVNNPDELFLNRRTGRTVAVKRDDQALVAVYDAVNDHLEVVTVFKTSKPDKLIRRKLDKGHWVRVG
jgi:hypothetical protein